MLLAGWIDLGLPVSRITRLLGRLGFPSIGIRSKRLRRGGLAPLQVKAVGSPGRTGEFRQVEFLKDKIRHAKVPGPVRQGILRALEALARAESKVHGHAWKGRLHQVGRADMVAAFAGFSLGLLESGVRRVYTSSIPLGRRHQDPSGIFRKTPGPATQRLLSRLPTQRRPEPFEWVTPTAAALLAAFGSPSPAPPFRVLRIGQAAGSGHPPCGSGVLRLFLGEPL